MKKTKVKKLRTANPEQPAAKAESKPIQTPVFQILEVAALVPSPTNQRKEFGPTELAELSESIRAKGVQETENYPLQSTQNFQFPVRFQTNREGWLNCHPRALLSRLKEEVSELERAFDESDRGDIAGESADVANFAMMIADWFEHRATGK